MATSNYIDQIRDKSGNSYDIHAAANTITSTQIKSGAVTAAKLSTSAVTTIKIDDGAITSDKLSADVMALFSATGVTDINNLQGSLDMYLTEGTSSGYIALLMGGTGGTSTQEAPVKGLKTAAYYSSTAFAPAYNYVKTVNGVSADSSGNVQAAESIYTLKYGSSVNVSEVTALLAANKPIRLQTQWGSVGENHESEASIIWLNQESNYATFIRCAYDSASSLYDLTFQRTGIIECENPSDPHAITTDNRTRVETFRWNVTENASQAAKYGWESMKTTLATQSNASLTGVPEAPTASSATESDQIATTAFVKAVTRSLNAANIQYTGTISQASNVSVALEKLRTSIAMTSENTDQVSYRLDNLDAASISCRGQVPGEEDVEGVITWILAHKADLDSPIFTGTPSAPTASRATSTTQIATTAFVHSVTGSLSASDIKYSSTSFAGASTVHDALSQIASSFSDLNGISIAYTPMQPYISGRTVETALNELTFKTLRDLSATTVNFDGTVSQFPSNIDNVQEAIDYLKEHSSGASAQPLVLTYGSEITNDQFYDIHTNHRFAFLVDPQNIISASQSTSGMVSYGYVTTSRFISENDWSINFIWSYGAVTAGTMARVRYEKTWSADENAYVGTWSVTFTDFPSYDDFVALSSTVSTKANISSPTFTGAPKAPTASSATNTTQIATTAFVQAIAVPMGSAVASLQQKVSALTTDDIKDATDPQLQYTATDWLNSLQSTKANINSPTFTGTPKAPTASAGTSTTQIATTAFAYNAAKCVKVEYGSTVDQSAIQKAYFSDSKYILCYEDEAPDYGIYQLTHIDDEQGQGDAYDFCQIRDGRVHELHYDAGTDSWSSSHYSIVTSSQLSTKANLSSPNFTGVPKAPTASAGTSTTQLATTAFVQQALSNAVGKNICQAFTASTQYVDAGESRMSFSLPASVTARDWDTFVIGSDLSLYSGGIKILQGGRYKLTGVAHIEPAQSYPTGFGIYQLASGSSSFTNLTSTYGMHEYGTDLYVTTTRQLFSGTVVGLYGLADPSIQTDVEYNNLSLLVEQIDKNDPVEPIDPLNPSDGEITDPDSGNETV